MAKHYNPTINEDTRRIFNLKTGDMLGSDVGNMIVPVIPIQRFCNITSWSQAINATSGTIYTTPTDKDFYLCGATLSFIKDATSTSTYSRIVTTIQGTTRILCPHATLTLTAQSGNSSHIFNPPLKIDKGVIISINNETNVANITSNASIWGYTVETIN